MLTSMEASASNHELGGLQQKSYPYDKNIYIAPQSTRSAWYVKDNRYMPLYMVVLGRYRAIQGVMVVLAPLWVGMPQVCSGMVCFPYIVYALSLYKCSLYIVCSSSPSTASSNSYRTLTAVLDRQCDRPGTTLAYLRYDIYYKPVYKRSILYGTYIVGFLLIEESIPY